MGGPLSLALPSEEVAVPYVHPQERGYGSRMGKGRKPPGTRNPPDVVDMEARKHGNSIGMVPPRAVAESYRQVLRGKFPNKIASRPTTADAEGRLRRVRHRHHHVEDQGPSHPTPGQDRTVRAPPEQSSRRLTHHAPDDVMTRNHLFCPDAFPSLGMGIRPPLGTTDNRLGSRLCQARPRRPSRRRR
jgi:hypothetical protein